MAVLTGWYALGTGVDNTGAFQEATTYTRPAVSQTGNAVAGLTQAVSQITGPTGPVGGILTKGAVFTAVTGGTALIYWDWITLTAVPNNFLALTVNMSFNSYVQAALNLSLQGGAGASGATIDAGSQIGLVNGNPMIAAQRLLISGGALLALGTGRVAELNGGTMYWQNAGVNVGSLDTSGNLSLLGTATTLTTTGKLTVAGGGVDLLITVGGVAVASIGTAGNLVLKGTVTSSGTPS